MNMTERARQLNVQFTARLSNDLAPEDFPPGSRQWDCVLSRGRRTLRVPFAMGPALEREPTVSDVLSCLASDCAGYDNATDFEEWCNEYEYDSDSRKAERIYDEIAEQRTDLMTLLGAYLYDKVVYNTESD